MSTISASTTSTTAYKVTADTTGTLVLQTGASPTTAVTIDTSQNVGIGTGSPQNLLNVVKNSANASAATNAGIALQSDSGATYTAGLHFGTDKAGVLSYIQSDSSASYSAVPLAINPLGGNVGIGTTAPTYKISFGANIGKAIALFENAGGTNMYGIGMGGAGTSGDPYRTKFFSNGTEYSALDAVGNFLVGTTNPVQVTDSSATNGWYTSGVVTYSKRSATSNLYHYAFYNPNGNVGYIATSGSTTTFSTSSDYRLKENVQPMTGALSVVQALKPCTYTWKVDGAAGQGFIAHELQEVVPDCVTGEKDAVDADGNPVYQGIDTSFLVATLTAAIQEQQAIIQQLTARIETLEAK